jgi:hypothetical protein
MKFITVKDSVIIGTATVRDGVTVTSEEGQAIQVADDFSGKVGDPYEPTPTVNVGNGNPPPPKPK